MMNCRSARPVLHVGVMVAWLLVIFGATTMTMSNAFSHSIARMSLAYDQPSQSPAAGAITCDKLPRLPRAEVSPELDVQTISEAEAQLRMFHPKSCPSVKVIFPWFRSEWPTGGGGLKSKVNPLATSGTDVAMHDGTPLPIQRVEQVRKIVEAELDRYPPQVLDGRLRSIIIFDTLSGTDAINIAGTYLSGSSVYLAASANQTDWAIPDEHIARTLHHELSSLFVEWYRDKFDETRFRTANASGFVYEREADPVAAGIKYAAGGLAAPASLQDLTDGFLEPYGRMDIENDFNTYAEVLLWRPQLLDQFSPDSSVGRKSRVVRSFYISIDPRFEGVFVPRVEPTASPMPAPDATIARQLPAQHPARSGKTRECMLDDVYPPPTPGATNPVQDRCLNQFQTNILICQTCLDFGITIESYQSCLDRAREIHRECQVRTRDTATRP